MLDALALVVVIATGTYLLGFAAVALLRPARAGAFLLGFAGSPFKHYAELATRVFVGAAFLVLAPSTIHPQGFALFGAVLVASTAALLLVPWQWHRRFAGWAVPLALKRLALVALCSLVAGASIIAAALYGPAM